jgi:TonB family protein
MMVAAHLLQSTACVGIAALLAFGLRRAPARTRYAIWLFASLKFLVPLSLLTAMGTYVGAWTPLATPRVSVVMRWLDQSFLSWGFDQPAARAGSLLPGDMDRLAALTVVGLWAAGVAGLTIWRWRQWRELAVLAQRLPRLEEGRETEALDRITRIMACPVRIQILRCDASTEPGVLGVFQPNLLWPNRLSDRLSDAELESLLAHEVCHVTRRDNLIALIHVAVETLFWFHPAVWWVGSRLVSERERACDEEVLQMGTDNRIYAEGILKVCNFGFRKPVAFVAGIAGPRLAERIEWILERQSAATLTRSARLLLAAIVAASLGVPVAAGALSSHRGSPDAGMAVTACPVTMPVAERPPNDPNASPFVGDWYANADRTMWASGGSPVPGTLRTKVLWVRPVGSDLKIDARRLDGDAGPVSVTIPGGYATTFQPSGLTFSAPGCWQVTGTAGGRSLQFVVSLAAPDGSAARNVGPSISGVPAGSANNTPASQQDAPQVYRPGQGITHPRLVKEVKPKYTPEAMEAKIQGSIKLEAVVLATGEVGDVDIIESLDKVYGLDDEAVKCMSQWRFEPGTKDGKPVAVRVEVEMSFTLK